MLESAMLDRSRHGATRASLEATNAVAARHTGGRALPGRAGTARARPRRCRAALGPRDPDTLVVEGNLAVTHICLEHFEHGLDRDRQCRGSCDGARRHPPPHDGRRHALATAYHVADLLPTRSRCLPGSRAAGRTLGPAHPDALVSRIGLALARIDSGDVAGAVAGCSRRPAGCRAVGGVARRGLNRRRSEATSPTATCRARPPRPGNVPYWKRAATDVPQDPAGGEINPDNGRPDACGSRAAAAHTASRLWSRCEP
jgi:hypothetical protein